MFQVSLLVKGKWIRDGEGVRRVRRGNNFQFWTFSNLLQLRLQEIVNGIGHSFLQMGIETLLHLVIGNEIVTCLDFHSWIETLIGIVKSSFHWVTCFWIEIWICFGSCPFSCRVTSIETLIENPWIVIGTSTWIGSLIETYSCLTSLAIVTSTYFGFPSVSESYLQLVWFAGHEDQPRPIFQ